MGGVRAGAGLVREGGREGGVRGSTRRMATVGHGGGTVRGDRPTTPPCGGSAAVSTGRLCDNGRPQEPRCTNKSPQCSTLATRGCPSACSGPRTPTTAPPRRPPRSVRRPPRAPAKQRPAVAHAAHAPTERPPTPAHTPPPTAHNPPPATAPHRQPQPAPRRGTSDASHPWVTGVGVTARRAG